MGCDECWTENERLYLISGTEFTLCRGCMLNLIENDGPMCITALNGPIEAVKEEWGVDDHKVSTPYGCTLCIYLTPLSPKWGNWGERRAICPPHSSSSETSEDWTVIVTEPSSVIEPSH